jgi:hypothetical protein
MSWITAQDPKLVGGQYGAITPHIFYPGGFHHHDGMPVKGMDHQHRTLQPAFCITGDSGAKIRAAMKKAGVTQRQLAKHCGRAYTTLVRGLSGGASFHQPDVDKINELLGLKVELVN